MVPNTGSKASTFYTLTSLFVKEKNDIFHVGHRFISCAALALFIWSCPSLKLQFKQAFVWQYEKNVDP